MRLSDRDKIRNKYKSLVSQYGTSSQAAGYEKVESQFLRFKVLTEISDLYSDYPLTVLDYGCGLGDLFFYLIFNGFKGKYIGLDITPEVIRAAKIKYGIYKQAKFYVGDVKDISQFQYDYALMSGVFNDRVSNNEKMFKEAIEEIYKQSKLAVAFNLLSVYATKRYSTMYYRDPGEILSFCLKKLSDNVSLRHDYRGGNFTVYLYKRIPLTF